MVINKTLRTEGDAIIYRYDTHMWGFELKGSSLRGTDALIIQYEHDNPAMIAFYMFRLYYGIFWGTENKEAHLRNPPFY